MNIKIVLAIEFAVFGVILATACYDAQEDKHPVKEKTGLTEVLEYDERYVEGVVAPTALPEGDWSYFSVSPQYNSLYMGIHCITDETSPQYQWLQTHDWSYDDEGICTYDGRTLVALTATFGTVGDYVDLLLADGTILNTIIVDEKADASPYGHEHDGWTNVIEIIVSPEWYDTEHENKIYPEVIGWRNIW